MEEETKRDGLNCDSLERREEWGRGKKRKGCGERGLLLKKWKEGGRGNRRSFPSFLGSPPP